MEILHKFIKKVGLKRWFSEWCNSNTWLSMSKTDTDYQLCYTPIDKQRKEDLNLHKRVMNPTLYPWVISLLMFLLAALNHQRLSSYQITILELFQKKISRKGALSFTFHTFKTQSTKNILYSNTFKRIIKPAFNKIQNVQKQTYNRINPIIICILEAIGVEPITSYLQSMHSTN